MILFLYSQLSAGSENIRWPLKDESKKNFIKVLSKSFSWNENTHIPLYHTSDRTWWLYCTRPGGGQAIDTFSLSEWQFHFSSSFWSSREIALTCTAFIVSSVYEKIVDYYFVVLLKKILLALQVPVVLLLYMTSLSTQFHADKPLAIKNPCRCFNSGCTDSPYRFVGIAKPWNLKLIINIDMGKKNNKSVIGWNSWVLVSMKNFVNLIGVFL